MSKGQLRVGSFMVHIYFQILGYFVINDVPYHLERIVKSSVLYLLNLPVFIVTITLYDGATCFLLLGALTSVYNVPYFLFMHRCCCTIYIINIVIITFIYCTKSLHYMSRS